MGGSLVQLADVAVGVGDVLAGGSTVVQVGRRAAVLGGPALLTQRPGRVEHASHGAAGIDLQQRVGEHVAGLPDVGQHASGELLVPGVHALPVDLGGRAADAFTVEQEPVVPGKLLESV